MKKTLKILAAAGLMTIAMGMTAFAGQWKQDATGWWYDNGNGTWPASTWQWIDGNQDGISECYYFDPSGYMAANTITPDGYTVDANGAWTVNGVVQKQVSFIIVWDSDEYFDDEEVSSTADEYDENDDSEEEYDWIIRDWEEYDEAEDLADEEEVEDKDFEEEVEGKTEEADEPISEEEAQERILEMESDYPEGMDWTNDNYYQRGNNIGHGCIGFAYLVQDEVFGKDSKSEKYRDFDPDHLHIGDHIRLHNRSGSEHSVIILDIFDDEVELVEGNYNSSIHWGRTMSFDEMESNFIYGETRY